MWGEGTLVKSLGENSLREIGHLVNVYFQVVKWTCTSWNLVSFGEKIFNSWNCHSIGENEYQLVIINSIREHFSDSDDTSLAIYLSIYSENDILSRLK